MFSNSPVGRPARDTIAFVVYTDPRANIRPQIRETKGRAQDMQPASASRSDPEPRPPQAVQPLHGASLTRRGTQNILFHGKRHPKVLSEAEIVAFLDRL